MKLATPMRPKPMRSGDWCVWKSSLAGPISTNSQANPSKRHHRLWRPSIDNTSLAVMYRASGHAVRIGIDVGLLTHR